MAYQFDIIDVTLGDGSNAVDFQFSKQETYGIVKGLTEAGIRWIELGHGYGLNASNCSKPAKETDETYITIALTYGYAGFRSAFSGVMKKAAAKYGVDPRTLVIESCKVDRVNPTEELFDRLAARLAGK